MALAQALRTAAVTAAVAGAALFGIQAAPAGESTPAGTSAQADGPAPAGPPTPAPSPSNVNNPWD
ncbi:hypothetical protein [Streptomyces sp. NBC_00690]|uniref:hypothetical protein n=1 Tax=Streptomyces sp. NBC_00690 TaxID=2975808 RepID=UPI002E2A4EDF|nr:hypothetical protein [Streptomyces sp. NBC_00690]